MARRSARRALLEETVMDENTRKVHIVNGGMAGGVLLALWFSFAINRCEPKRQCERDVATRTAKPEHAKDQGHYTFPMGECWCFDPRTGESTRLW
jgi:hypothetical protein